MIDISTLNEDDKGREVAFICPHGQAEYGHLSSWNARYVFVRFRGPNVQACDPAMCAFTLPQLW